MQRSGDFFEGDKFIFCSEGHFKQAVDTVPGQKGLCITGRKINDTTVQRFGAYRRMRASINAQKLLIRDMQIETK